MSNSPALEWLYGVEKIGVKLGLESTRRLFEALEIDTSSTTVIHVAGTNGKGSTCAFIEAICRKLGKKTGLYTSPHLVNFNERIRVDFTPVDQAKLDGTILLLRDMVSNWDPHPTYFELSTALAVKTFVDAKVDVIVLETGLGGRLDSTNVVKSDLAVITQIALDHQAELGDTIQAIAGEKAGIIKPNQIVVTGNQRTEAHRVISARADEVGADFHVVKEAWLDEIGLSGGHQRWNAALAAEAIRSAFGDCETEIKSGIQSAVWPARFQLIDRPNKRPVIIDGAHNPAAMREVVRSWRDRFGAEKAAIVFGAVSDKEPQKLLAELTRITGALFPTSTPTERGLSAEELVEQTGITKANAADSFRLAIRMAEATQLPVLVTGSLFLAGEAVEYFEAI
ncbi:MAG: folylpolyglutamate synthase/dihydrofolate synthase family protein [Verrucomicrobiota bacterium]